MWRFLFTYVLPYIIASDGESDVPRNKRLFKCVSAVTVNCLSRTTLPLKEASPPTVRVLSILISRV